MNDKYDLYIITIVTSSIYTVYDNVYKNYKIKISVKTQISFSI